MAAEIVTSCPLCLALSDPADMVDIEIDRVVPRGRAHVLLCRTCGSAVTRSMAKAGEPLAKEMIELDQKEAERPPAKTEAEGPTISSGPTRDIVGVLAQKAASGSEEPDDGESTA